MLKVELQMMDISKDKFQILEFITDYLVQMKWLKLTIYKDLVAVIFINIHTNSLQLIQNVSNVVIAIAHLLIVRIVQIVLSFLSISIFIIIPYIHFIARVLV